MGDGPIVHRAAAEGFDASCSQCAVLPKGSALSHAFSRQRDGKIVALGVRLKNVEDAEQDRARCRDTGG